MAQAPTPRFSNEQKQPVVIQNKMPKADPADLTGQFGGGGAGTGATFRLIGNTGNQAGTQTASNPYPQGYTSGIPYGFDTTSGPGASYQPTAGTGTSGTDPKADPGTTGTGSTRGTTNWGGKYVPPVDNPGPYNPLDIGRGIGWGYPGGWDPNTPSPGTTGTSPTGFGGPRSGGGGTPPTSDDPPRYMTGTSDLRLMNTGGNIGGPPGSASGGGSGGSWLTVGNPSGMTQQSRRPAPGAAPGPRAGVPGPQGGHWGQNRGWRQGIDGYQGPGPVVAPPGSGGGTPAGGGENAMYGRRREA